MISKDKTQICVVLPNEVVELLDKQAKEQLRTRSMEAAKIIIDYFNVHKK